MLPEKSGADGRTGARSEERGDGQKRTTTNPARGQRTLKEIQYRDLLHYHRRRKNLDGASRDQVLMTGNDLGIRDPLLERSVARLQWKYHHRQHHHRHPRVVEEYCPKAAMWQMFRTMRKMSSASPAERAVLWRKNSLAGQPW